MRSAQLVDLVLVADREAPVARRRRQVQTERDGHLRVAVPSVQDIVIAASISRDIVTGLGPTESHRSDGHLK